MISFIDFEASSLEIGWARMDGVVGACLIRPRDEVGDRGRALVGRGAMRCALSASIDGDPAQLFELVNAVAGPGC